MLSKKSCKAKNCSTDTRFHDREILEHETPLGQRYSADCARHPGQGSAAGPSPARLWSRVQTRTSSSFVLQGKRGYDGCLQQAILYLRKNELMNKLHRTHDHLKVVPLGL